MDRKSDKQTIRDVIEWDVAAWSQVLPFWKQQTGNLAGMKVLDIGSCNGGLSLHFALEGCSVVCSDLDGPTKAAEAMHERYSVSEAIDYRKIDATRIDFPGDVFDIVCFKSILGGIGKRGNWPRVEQAIREMHRVLKPGGKLLFAENLRGSPLHMLARRLLVQWGSAWRYIAISELPALLASFTNSQLKYYGFLSAFGRTERQSGVLHGLDVVIHPIVPKSFRYIVFGCATK